MMSFALYCMLFGLLVFCPKTDAKSLTWKQPPPFQNVEAVSSPDEHFNSTKLHEGTTNATLSWHFGLRGLTFVSLVILFDETSPVAGVKTSGQAAPQRGFENQFGIEWIPNQNFVKLIIFNVTTRENGTFTCRVTTDEEAGVDNFQFRSSIQVDVVDRPRNIVTSSDRNVTAPAELTLDCSADGKPKPTITWTRVSDNTVVTMPVNVTRGKNKESYRCTASNGVGNPLSKDVTVNVLFSPKVTLLKKFFVDREQAASLICQVEGNPEPTISWSPCDPPHVCDKQYLNISKVQTARSYYNCTARNAVGIDSAMTVLLIGGYNIYLRMNIIVDCDMIDSVWEALKKKFTDVFATTQSYSGAELIPASCGSMIFDMVLKFSIKVAEDDTIAIIQSAIVDGKLGELNVNTSYIIGIPPVPQTTTAPASTTPKSDDNKTGLIIGIVLGSVAFVALIVFIIWCVRKKKCCSETKEVSDNTDATQGRKGKGQKGGDEAAYASTSMLPHSKRTVEKTNQGTVQALPMYAQVDKTKKTSNKGGAAQRQRQPGELQYAEVEHVTSGRSLPRKSSSEPIKPSNEEIVYADLV